MVCEDLSIMGSDIGMVEILIYPTTCFYYFYAVIFFALFIVIALYLYNKEREKFTKADMIGSLATSSTAILFLSLIGTLIKTSSGIPMVQNNIFLYIFAIWIILVSLWFFKKD